MNGVDMRTLASCFDLPENMAITSVHPLYRPWSSPSSALTRQPAARSVPSPLNGCIADTDVPWSMSPAQAGRCNSCSLFASSSVTLAIAPIRFSRNAFQNWSSHMRA